MSAEIRLCICCGAFFEKDPLHPKRRKCPECFEQDPHSHNTERIRTTSHFREMKRAEEIEAQKRRERIRLRDDAYARWERENGVAPRFEYRGNSVVEVRGRCGT